MKRLLVVLGALLSLAGCKLVIVVPEGARVVSSSGLYNCEAGTRCEIDIDHLNFHEKFTVEPKIGYRFVDWRKGHGYFCGGSQKAQCGALSTRGFADDASLMALLDSKDEFYLAPRVVPDGTVPLSHRSMEMHTKAFYEVFHYPVSGETYEEISDDLHGKRSPLLQKQCSSWALGCARSTFRVTYRFNSAAGRSGYCELQHVDVWTRHKVTMPTPEVPAQLAAPLKIQWDRFYDALWDHEAGHVAITREVVVKLRRDLEGLGPTPCDQIKGRVSTLLTRADAEIDRRNKDFDVETNRGIFTGAVW